METNKFNKFELDNEIQEALKDMGFEKPSKVQSQVIPLALEYEDIVVRANTGSGKTAAYGIPVCEKIGWQINKPQVLVLTPTRELAIQATEDLTNIGRYKRVKVVALLGGRSLKGQRIELKQKTHIVVGTPGRTLDHIRKGSLRIDLVDNLIIDEADEMLNMGFIDQVESIIKQLSSDRQTMLFSATIPKKVENLARKYMKNPISIDVEEEGENADKVPDTIEHFQYKTEEIDKLRLLLDLMIVENADSAIIFCNTQDQVERVYDSFKSQAYSCGKIHGGLEQKERTAAMNRFKEGRFRYLIATNLVARGIDVDDLPLIINFDLAPDKEIYAHRIGRTARAGRSGKAISLITPYDQRYVPYIEKYIAKKIIELEKPIKEEVSRSQESFDKKMKSRPKLKLAQNLKLNKDIIRLRMNVGSKKGIRAGTLVGIISNIRGVSAEDIGIITVMETMSFVEILNGKGDNVLNILKKTKVKGKNLNVRQVDLRN